MKEYRDRFYNINERDAETKNDFGKDVIHM
jgi:hypothetical protein